MKKLYTLSLLMIGVLSFGQTQESFNFTGALNANGWSTHSGATPGQLMTSASSITYSGFTSTGNKLALVAGNTEDVNKASAAPLTGVVYYSALLNVPTVTGLGVNTGIGDYFIATAATAGTGVTPSPPVTAFSARIYIRNGSVADTFNLGVLNNSGGTAAPTYSATDYPINTALFVIVKNDLGTNTASLFVNPIIGGTEGTPTVMNATGTTAAPAQVASIVIREGGTATSGTGNVEVDEIKLGSTYAYVASGVLATKQPNAIAGLKVYPNPVTNGNLYITSDSNEIQQVAIFDVVGKQVLKATLTTEEPVNVSTLNSGVYMIKITENGKTATRKLVIK